MRDKINPFVLELEEGKVPNVIILRGKNGRILAKWKRAEGSWKSFTDRVNTDGHYGHFLVYEECEVIR